jgi:short-subunit dehydrogenase
MTAKHVLITGASSGIGRALAARYAREGARLSLFGRNAERLQAAVEECRAAGAAGAESYIADVRDSEAMKGAVARAEAVAPIDVVVANAGVSSGPSPSHLLERPESVRATFAINVMGVLNTIEPTVPTLAKRRTGQVAIVGSMTGLRGLPFSPAYCATKAAVHSYATSLRGTLARSGVDVTLVVPGWVDTPMSQRVKSWKASMITDEQAAEIIWRGLERRKAVIAFPLYMYWMLRFFELAPARLVDYFMLRFSADVPATSEKEAAG